MAPKPAFKDGKPLFTKYVGSILKPALPIDPCLCCATANHPDSCGGCLDHAVGVGLSLSGTPSYTVTCLCPSNSAPYTLKAIPYDGSYAITTPGSYGCDGTFFPFNPFAPAWHIKFHEFGTPGGILIENDDYRPCGGFPTFQRSYIWCMDATASCNLFSNPGVSITATACVQSFGDSVPPPSSGVLLSLNCDGIDPSVSCQGGCNGNIPWFFGFNVSNQHPAPCDVEEIRGNISYELRLL